MVICKYFLECELWVSSFGKSKPKFDIVIVLAGSDSRQQQRNTHQPIHRHQHPAADGGPQLIIEDILFCVFLSDFWVCCICRGTWYYVHLLSTSPPNLLRPPAPSRCRAAACCGDVIRYFIQTRDWSDTGTRGRSHSQHTAPVSATTISSEFVFTVY